MTAKCNATLVARIKARRREKKPYMATSVTVKSISGYWYESGQR